MKVGNPRRPQVEGDRRLAIALALLFVAFGAMPPVAARADDPAPPEPFEIRLEVVRRSLPPAPAPFAIQLVVSRSQPPPIPQPFAIDLTVVRSEPIPPPQPFAIDLTVSREIPSPPAPFPVRVTVVRQDLPTAPAPFPVRVKVVRNELPTAPPAFPIEVVVSRREPPVAPAPFPLEVVVSRREPPVAPVPFPVQVTISRPPPPPPPAAFPVRVNVVRLEADPEVQELLAELRRLEEASAEEAEAARRSEEVIEQALRKAEHLLETALADLQAALQFLGTAEERMEALGEIRGAAQRHESAAAAGEKAVVDTSLEVCAFQTVTTSGAFAGELMADLERKVGEAEARVGEVAATADRCREGSEELRSGLREWQAQWTTAIEGASEAVERQVEEAAAALIEAATVAEELGSTAIRVGELEARAAPLSEEIEQRAATWTSASLAETRQEVLTEERRLSGLIGGRVAQVLEIHDFQAGAIESQQNQLDLVRGDLESLARETSRVRRSLQPGLSGLLSGTDAAARGAAASAAKAVDAAAAARSCLQGIQSRVAAAAATLKTVPGLEGRSDDVAIAWLEELELRPFLRGGESTLEEAKAGTVARQAPPGGTRLRPGETVSLWIYASAVKPPPSTNVPIPTQASCSAEWPGTILVTEPGGGNPRCECPSGQAWSKVSNRCLALDAGGGGDPGTSRSRDCTHRAGTVFDPRTGRCDCVLGDWVAAEGRCVDATVGERQKAIDNARTDLDCEQLLSSIRTFRRHPSSLQRDMASSAETKARSLGCDDSAIKEAVEEGDRRVWVEPPTGGGGVAVPVGPEVPEQREDLQPLTRPPGQPPSGTGDDPQPSGDCSRCTVYSDWLEENRGPCGYHPLRLPSICELDPECVYWAEECVRQQRLSNECMAGCSG